MPASHPPRDRSAPPPDEPLLLACDIDGTILDPDGHLRPRVRDALRVVAGAGVIVLLASGRSPWGMRGLCSELGLRGPQITMHGGLIVSPITGDVLHASPLSDTDVRRHVEFAHGLGLEVFCTHPEGYRAEVPPSPALLEVVAPSTAVGGPPFEVVPSLAGSAGPRPIRTVLVTPPGRAVEARAAALGRFGDAYSLVWSDDIALELLAPGVNKGAALRLVAERHGVRMDAVAAIGDAPNDIEMLRCAGRSAAMASAPPDVRDAATLVVPPNSDDGAFEALRAFFPLTLSGRVPVPGLDRAV